jgi:hypothetical protein
MLDKKITTKETATQDLTSAAAAATMDGLAS